MTQEAKISWTKPAFWKKGMVVTVTWFVLDFLAWVDFKPTKLEMTNKSSNLDFEIKKKFEDKKMHVQYNITVFNLFLKVLFPKDVFLIVAFGNALGCLKAAWSFNEGPGDLDFAESLGRHLGFSGIFSWGSSWVWILLGGMFFVFFLGGELFFLSWSNIKVGKLVRLTKKTKTFKLLDRCFSFIM